MLVKELIEKLLEYNMQSNVSLSIDYDEEIIVNVINGKVVLLRGTEAGEVIDTTEKDTLINETLECVNFESIHKCMEALNRTWYCADGEYRVPTIEELKKEATNLLSDGYDTFKTDGENYEVNAYGFNVFVGHDDEGDLEMKIEFVIEDGYGYRLMN